MRTNRNRSPRADPGVAARSAAQSSGVSQCLLCITLRQPQQCDRRKGTSLERIAAESLTRRHSLFAPLDIWQAPLGMPLDRVPIRPQVDRSPKCISIGAADHIDRGVSSRPPRSCRCERGSRARMIGAQSTGRRIGARYCVLAVVGVGRAGCATPTNWVASSTAGPSRVGTWIRYGTKMRVPTIGASQISMSRCSIRYLIA